MGFDPMMIMAGLQLLQGLQNGGDLFGNKEKHGSTYTKGQRSVLDSAIDSVKNMQGNSDITANPQYQQGNNWLMSMFNDPNFFQQFEAPIQRNFEENTIPDLANRFAASGSGGALGSTAFRNQLAREGSNLHTNIAALRGGMQQQAIPQLMNSAQMPINNFMQMLNSVLQPQPNNTYQGPTPGLWGNLTSGLTSGMATGYGQQWGQNMANNNMAKPQVMPGTAPTAQ